MGRIALMATTSGQLLRIVDSRTAERPVARYAARIRWTCVADPDWEIDTRHFGFESWRQAACFANGLSEDGASALFLDEGRLILQLVDGRDLLLDENEATIWRRASDMSAALPENLRFLRDQAGLRKLSAIGLDGAFSPLRFGVDDLRGPVRLDVRVEADARKRAVTVTLAIPGREVRSEREEQAASALFDLPRA